MEIKRDLDGKVLRSLSVSVLLLFSVPRVPCLIVCESTKSIKMYQIFNPRLKFVFLIFSVFCFVTTLTLTSLQRQTIAPSEVGVNARFLVLESYKTHPTHSSDIKD